MKKITRKPALPQVNVEKVGQKFSVHWDHQTAPESSILLERRDYLDGYIYGAFAGLGIVEKNIACAASTVGTVTKLDEETALKLAKILEDLLIPVVKAEHKRLMDYANLPHVRLLAESEEESA